MTPLSEEAIGGMVGEGAALLVKRALDAAGLDHPSSRSPVPGDLRHAPRQSHSRVRRDHSTSLHLARAMLAWACSRTSRRSNEEAPRCVRDRDLFESVIGGDGPYPRKPSPEGCLR